MTSRIIANESDKQALINQLSEARAGLALFYDDLEELPACAKKVGDGVAIISPPYEFEELETLWHYGNWNLVSPPNTKYEPLDTFRRPDSEVAQAMSLHGLSLIIDSFHDNIEWKVHEIA